VEPAKDRMRDSVSEPLDRACAGRVNAPPNALSLSRMRAAGRQQEGVRDEQRHPIGSKARLALALLLLTGQRRSDIITFGKQHVREAKNVPANLRTVHRGRWLAFTQRKNKKRKPISLMVPLLPELEEIIAATPCGDLTWLVTQFGQPFTSPGFGNWFRVRCDQAGLPHCTAHGLRKAGATIAAERGASDSLWQYSNGRLASRPCSTRARPSRSCLPAVR